MAEVLRFVNCKFKISMSISNKVKTKKSLRKLILYFVIYPKYATHFFSYVCDRIGSLTLGPYPINHKQKPLS